DEAIGKMHFSPEINRKHYTFTEDITTLPPLTYDSGSRTEDCPPLRISAWSISVRTFSLKAENGGFPGGSVAKNPSADTEDTVRSLIQEDPTGQGATKRMRHSYGACGLEPRSRNYCSLGTLEPTLHKRSRRSEKPEHRNEEQRCSPQLEKSPAQ
ncbi:hypothetical protein MJT46_013554, partial [Ovis ammon polii x Ovis aries]